MNRFETLSVANPSSPARGGDSSLVTLHRRVVSGERGFGLALLRAGLTIPAVIYDAVARLRNRLYDFGWFAGHAVPARVISVGNLTAGGTGKTPVVIALARAAISAGHQPAVLLRGYRKDGAADSDEARLLERALPGTPIVVGPDRVRSARIAIAHGADLLLLDDGFQHRRLARDVDVVLLDARDPFGGGWQLPRGFRREPVSGLSRAHVVVLTRVDRLPVRDADGVRRAEEVVARRTRAGTPILRERHRAVRLVDRDFAPIADVDSLRGRRTFAFSGIGDPSSLAETLVALGANVVGCESFPDHHEFTDSDLERLGARAGELAAEVTVTTEKDLARLSGRAVPFPVSALSIEACFEPGEPIAEASRRLGFPWPTS